MPEDLPLTGGCGCGAVRFEIDAPLTAALYCHCTRCQHRTGAAAGTTGRARVLIASFKYGCLAPGELRLRGKRPRTALL